MTGAASGWGLPAAVAVIAGAVATGTFLATHGGSPPVVPAQIVVGQVAATTSHAPTAPPGQRPKPRATGTPSVTTPATTPAPVVVPPSRPVVTEPPDDHGGSGRGGDG